MNKKIFATIMFVIALFISLPSEGTSAPQQVELWCYYDFAPFAINNNRDGLTIELSVLLTEMSAGRYQFIPRYLPRKRIDELLLSNAIGVVALVNPAWFPKYLLRSSALLVGYDTIISPSSAHVNAISKETIEGKRFVGVLGHQYPLLKGELRHVISSRLNSSDMQKLFILIAQKRGDFSLVPSIVASYFRSNNSESSTLVHYSHLGESRYTRHLLMSPHHQLLNGDINQILKSEVTHRRWRNILKKYDVESMSIDKLSK